MARSLFGALGRGVQALARSGDGSDDQSWNCGWGATPSATGIQINQQTALQATTVMACVRILSEDVSKMTPRLYRRFDKGIHKKGAREQIAPKDHPLAALLHR